MTNWGILKVEAVRSQDRFAYCRNGIKPHPNSDLFLIPFKKFSASHSLGVENPPCG